MSKAAREWARSLKWESYGGKRDVRGWDIVRDTPKGIIYKHKTKGNIFKVHAKVRINAYDPKRLYFIGEYDNIKLAIRSLNKFKIGSK